MRWLVLIISTVILITYSASFKSYMKYEVSEKEKAVNKVMARNSRILAKKHNMQPFGVSVAMPGGDIQFLELEFQICGPYSKEKIREKLIKAVHDFLRDINDDSNLCFYLKNHHLTITDVGITLFLIDSSRRGLRHPNISIAKIIKGELEYDILSDVYDDELKLNIPQFKSKSGETYEEALQMLNS